MKSSTLLKRPIIKKISTPVKRKFIDGSKSYKSSRVFSKVKETPITKSLLSIKSKTIRVNNFLGSIFNFSKKTLGSKTKKAKVAKDSPNKKSSGKNLIEAPKTGALDWIKNFITMTFFGALLTTLLPLIPKLEWMGPLLKKGFEFLSWLFNFSLGLIGNVSILAIGAKDKIVEKVDEIKKTAGNIGKVFDDTTSALNDLIGGTIKVAESFLGAFGEFSNNIGNEIQSSGSITPDPFSELATSVTPKSTGTTKTYASGGDVDNGRIDPNNPISRGVKKEKSVSNIQKPNVQKQTTTPGKNTGGAKKVKELYDTEKNNGGFSFSFFGIGTPYTPVKSGFNALVGASNEYKKPRTEDIMGIGNLMGAAVDTTLGQKPDKKTYTQFSEGVKYLVNYGINNPKEFSKLNIELMVRNIIEPKVEQAINNIRKELNKKSSSESESGSDGGPGGGPGGGLGGGNIESIDMGGFSKEDIDALGKMIYAEASGESAVGRAAVLAVILNRYRLIKSGQVSPGTFAVTNKPRDQITIRDIIFAGGTGERNQFSPYKKGGSFYTTSSSSGMAALASAISAGGADPPKLRENLIKQAKLTPEDADSVTRSVFFSNPETRGSTPDRNSPQIKVGRHAFQESSNSRFKLRGSIEKIDATVKENPQQGRLLAEGGVEPSGYMNSKAGMRLHPIHGILKMHDGNDYAIEEGTPISLIKGGVATRSGFIKGYGESVEIKHDDGTRSFYAHLQKRNVRVGDRISIGTVIGTVGSTGDSRGPHLHFESDDKNGDKITDYKKLNSLANNTFRFGGSVRPSEVQTLAVKNDKEGVLITKDGKTTWKEQQWTPEQRRRHNEQMLKKAGESNTQKKRAGGLIKRKGTQLPLPAEKYAPYNDPSPKFQVLIQPIIITKSIPMSIGGNSPTSFIAPNVNSNNNSERMMRN